MLPELLDSFVGKGASDQPDGVPVVLTGMYQQGSAREVELNRIQYLPVVAKETLPVNVAIGEDQLEYDNVPSSVDPIAPELSA